MAIKSVQIASLPAELRAVCFLREMQTIRETLLKLKGISYYFDLRMALPMGTQVHVFVQLGAANLNR